MRPLFRLITLLLGLSACSSAQPTRVRLRLSYEESWPLAAFVVAARDKSVRLNATTPDGARTEALVVNLADDWAGDEIVYTVRAYVGVPGVNEELYASGHVAMTAVAGDTVDGVVVLARTACAVWCAPGSTFCRNGGVMVCEAGDVYGTGCPHWGAPSLCGNGQSCSIGECSPTCVDECAEGETRCSGPLGVEVCGQSDDDACRDWQQPILCEGAQVCSNGRCADTCTNECEAGSVRCRDAGVASCGDLNGDGCLEWGPSASCAASESCQGLEGMRGELGVAHCQARSSCTDLCTANSCANNTFTSCGNFNLDSCREPSEGAPCATANPCEEGTCDLTANGGAGGCVFRPRMSPECANGCFGQTDSASCDDNNACTVSDRCRDGVCAGTAVACNVGRPRTCDAGVARTYAVSGICMNGTCQYSVASEETCANGCDGAQCAAPVGNGAIQISAGGEHTCALLADDTVRCWGRGADGQTGPDAELNQETPTTVTLPPSAQLVAGGSHTCVLLRAGDVRCFGKGTDGQLGQGRSSSSDTPVNVVELGGARSIAAGDAHTCALLVDLTVACWGSNEDGQLGNNSSGISAFPEAVANLSGIAAIAAGVTTSCAVHLDQTVRCWGYDGLGGTPRTPQAVEGLAEVAAVSVGAEHVCALLTNHTVRCWGDGSFGQLGNGDRNATSNPALVQDLSNVTAISAGIRHTCALLADQTVQCWGSNDEGQLGNTGGEAASPVPVQNLAGVTAISAGGYHTCALLSNGGVRCWGAGAYGQLGNGRSGANYVEAAPVTVLGIP